MPGPWTLGGLPDPACLDGGCDMNACCKGHHASPAQVGLGVVAPVLPAQDEAVGGAIYTCPMHPEVRQIGPGSCPKCGMALEPLMPTLTDDDTEVRGVRRRFWLTVALALPVMLMAMVPHLAGGLALSHATARVLQILELALSTP